MKTTNNENYIKLIAGKGHKLTTYKEGEDIKEFSYFSEGVFPVNYPIENIREITVEEAERLQELAEEAHKEENDLS